MTSDSTVVPLRQPDAVDDPLTAILRSGARRLLAEAVEAEAERVKIFRLMTDSGVRAAGSMARIRSAVFWRGLCSGVGRSDWVVRSPA
jgi:hypothetical protein